MGRKKELIDEILVTQAETEFAKLSEGKLALQLRAIVSAGKHTVDQVAEIFGINRRSIFRWAERLKRGGIAALRDRPKGHMRSKLTVEQKDTLERWIVNGVDADGQYIHWTLGKLQQHIRKCFRVTISITPLWKTIRGMNLVLKRPRPLHAKANPEEQASYKKKSTRR